MNPILKRQLRRAGLDPGSPPTDEQAWDSLLAAVSTAYDEAARSLYLTERSLEISSSEMRELTEQIKVAAESNVAKERDRLRAVFDALNDGLCLLTEDGAVVHANEVAQCLLGIEGPTLFETTVLDRIFFVSDGERVGAQDAISAIRHGTPIRDRRAVVVRPDGSETPVACNLQPVINPDGGQAAVMVLHDLTDQERVHAALERSEAHYGSVIHRAPVAFLEEDFTAVGAWLDDLRRQGIEDLGTWLATHPEAIDEAAGLIRVVDANQAATDMLRARHRNDLLGKLDASTLTDATRESFRAQLDGMWHDQDLITTRVSGTRLDGSRLEGILNWAAPRILGQLDLAKVVVALVDVTDLTEAQERTEELVRSKDEFLAIISHELRTPLTAVSTSAALLTEEALTADEEVELLGYVREQAADMAQIVEDLLVAARADIGSLSLIVEDADLPLELGAVVDRFVSNGTKIDCSRVRGRVQADPLRLRQIMRNLLSNAQRYGGEEIWVESRILGGRATVSVFDDGPGVPESEREAIFEPYYRAAASKGVQGSVGMGLSVARQLAELMDGSLEYFRSAGRSEFRLELPAS